MQAHARKAQLFNYQKEIPVFNIQQTPLPIEVNRPSLDILFYQMGVFLRQHNKKQVFEFLQAILLKRQRQTSI
jgi:hypothetical protein